MNIIWNIKTNLPKIDQLKHCTKMKFSIKDFFSKCDQIRSFLRIWSHLLKKSLMGNFIFCAENEKLIRRNKTFRETQKRMLRLS